MLDCPNHEYWRRKERLTQIAALYLTTGARLFRSVIHHHLKFILPILLYFPYLTNLCCITYLPTFITICITPIRILYKMEGYDDTRCLPKMPTLFTTAPDVHPDLVLFSASSDTENSTKNTTPHALDTCNDGGKDDSHKTDGEQVHTPPSNAPHSTLMSPGDGKSMF